MDLNKPIITNGKIRNGDLVALTMSKDGKHVIASSLGQPEPPDGSVVGWPTKRQDNVAQRHGSVWKFVGNPAPYIWRHIGDDEFEILREGWGDKTPDAE